MSDDEFCIDDLIKYTQPKKKIDLTKIKKTRKFESQRNLTFSFDMRNSLEPIFKESTYSKNDDIQQTYENLRQEIPNCL